MDISIVIPVYNEAENVAVLCQELKAMRRRLAGEIEVLIVDDGSTDDTPGVLFALCAEEAWLKVIRLTRNFGQSAALAAGIAQAAGSVIVTLDGDLQNDPADVLRLVAKLNEGYDLVTGWRVHRQDPFLSRRLPSAVANRLISWITRIRLHDSGCMLKAFRSEVAKSLDLYGEMHRFIPALAAASGASIAELPVTHRPRLHGRSKYGIGRTLSVLLDLLAVKFLTGYVAQPIRVFGPPAVLATMAGSVLMGYLGIQRVFFSVPLADRPIVLLGLLLIVVGVQLLALGMLAEMLARLYRRTGRTPGYVIRRTSGHLDPMETFRLRADAGARPTWEPAPVARGEDGSDEK